MRKKVRIVKYKFRIVRYKLASTREKSDCENRDAISFFYVNRIQREKSQNCKI